MKKKIWYEDEGVVVIDKPAGVVVNRAESVVGETVQDWMESKIKDQISKIKDEEEGEDGGEGGKWAGV